MRRGGRRFILPLNAYLYALAATMALLLGLFGWATLGEIRETGERLDSLEHALAREEFSLALSDAVDRMQGIAERLTRWDEVRQQLQDPTYYSYWHQHRLRKPGTLPGFILEAGLYDGDGAPLARFHEDPLPERTPFTPNPRIWRSGERLLIEVTHPIPEGPHSPAGHVVLQADLLEAIRETFSFSRLDFSAIDVRDVPEHAIAVETLPGMLHLRPVRSMARQEFMETVERAMIRLTLFVVFLVLALLAFFSLLVRRPLTRLSEFVTKLRQGELSEEDMLCSQPIAELEAIRASLQDYHLQLETARLDLDERNRELWELAHKDPLTGSWNRRAFERDWKNLRSLLDGTRMEIAFLLFDCDHFKAINDSYGHQVGDEVIRIIAGRIQQVLRRGDRLYRLGGDEFATLMLECGRECAEKLAEHCQHAMHEEDFSRLGIHEPVHLSIGIAISDASSLPDLSELKRRADTAMYHAKRPGTHHICFHEPQMDEDEGMLYSSHAIHAVQRAVRRGEGVEMHYQPVFDLHEERVIYLEALARLKEDGELLMPGQFLPIVEAHRLEEEFDQAVLRAVSEDQERGLFPDGVGLSINLSASGLLSKRVMQLLGELAGIAGDRLLVLEITETTLITRLQDATRQIRLARELGYQVALDDFGSGYSSLRYLASMPVDIIKFDISMTRRILEGGRQREMIEGIAQMIGRAGYRTVAEGIEDEQALEIIRQAGFSHGQGYLFGRPARATLPGTAVARP